MKWEELKEILNEEFPPMSAMAEDFIGEQVSIKETINKVMITLDITLDVIAQAQESGADLIISHHPLFFGDKETLINKDKMLAAKVLLLENSGIGVYVIHTNADFNTNSIAYMQGLALGLEELDQNDGNLSVSGKLKEDKSAFELIQLIKDTLELKDVEFRTNFDLETNVSKVLIASGASGEQINYISDNIVNIIGEVKHHEWVKSRERNIKVIEISHFSEKIFKNIVNVFLEDTPIEVELSEEENGYKVI